MGVQLSGNVVEGNVRRMQTARHEGYRKSLVTAVDSAFPKATKRPSAATTHTARQAASSPFMATSLATSR